ncbi:MAG TPA: hypothetical protein VGQ99_10875 [Tepidisphaeraceae bacterium]|jgi:hypothetical protein|nr:hypothetical protein [Tepidisphaeraceae bacterium]
MKKANRARGGTEMKKEYDFRGGVRGKYASGYARGSNIIILSPDLAQIFPDSASVDRALRALVQVARRTMKRSA